MISIRGLSKKFGTHAVTNGLNLDIQEGEFLTIIGRSGEGKSVLLKQLMGLLKPESGSIFIDGIDTVPLTGLALSHTLKKCGYVFQFAALLDSLSVFENIGIVFLESGIAPHIVRPLALECIERVGLSGDVLDKYPDELSGGMKKRVGLARTLMGNPKIIFYDEPTTGLDPISTQLIHELLRSTHEQYKATTIVISHDVSIFKYSDSVAMLYEGQIIHKESAANIWNTDNAFIRQFIHGLSDGPLTATRKL
jgi:phospholipid/cholesterol/gamma-HCH transport system ATP-binding protein